MFGTHKEGFLPIFDKLLPQFTKLIVSTILEFAITKYSAFLCWSPEIRQCVLFHEKVFLQTNIVLKTHLFLSSSASRPAVG